LLVHKNANVLSGLPKAMHPTPTKTLADIRDAGSRRDAVAAVTAFTAEIGAKWPNAAAKVVHDADQLLAFDDLPAELWVHLKTSKPDRGDLRHRPPMHQGHERSEFHEQLGWPWRSS
jgi:transposase-like protein